MFCATPKGKAERKTSRKNNPGKRPQTVCVCVRCINRKSRDLDALEICTSNFEDHKVLHLPRTLHIEGHSAVPVMKSANEPRVQKSRFTAPVAKSELLDNHHHVQSAAPAKKTAVRSKTAPIPCTCHEKSNLKHQSTRFPLNLPRKMTTICKNAHGTTTRAQSLEAPAADTQIQRAWAVDCTSRISRGMNVL